MSALNGGPMLTVVSRSFPPQVSGSAILMANLLSSYAGDLHAVAGYSQSSRSDSAFLPPCPTSYLARQRILPRVYDGLLRRFPDVVCRSIRTSIQRTLAKLNTHVVLAAFPFDDFLVATFMAARRLHLPFYAYMHDLWIENKSAGRAEAEFAKRWEPVILKRGTRVLCITEAMQKHYETKYNIKTYLMPHSIAEEDFLQAPVEIRPPGLPKPTILFAGGVSSEMNVDSLRVLARASELLPKDYELLFCSHSDLRTLSRLGIRSSRLQIRYVSRLEVQRLQSNAHVLIAPLSHENCSKDEVRTVFSTKLLEYLVAGRPILVFAPEDSYQAESARRKGWGYVVTDNSPAALAAAIEKVIKDESLAASLVRGALKEARSRNAKRYAGQLSTWVYADTEITSEAKLEVPCWD
jgi:glycosyltransferase involved in cell wall biosynthesis